MRIFIRRSRFGTGGVFARLFMQLVGLAALGYLAALGVMVWALRTGRLG